MINLPIKSCASLLIHSEVMHLFVIGHSHCHATFWHEHKHTPYSTHTLDLCAKFQPSRAKTVAAEVWEVFVNQPTARQSDLKSCWSQLKMQFQERTEGVQLIQQLR